MDFDQYFQKLMNSRFKDVILSEVLYNSSKDRLYIYDVSIKVDPDLKIIIILSPDGESIALIESDKYDAPIESSLHLIKTSVVSENNFIIQDNSFIESIFSFYYLDKIIGFEFRVNCGIYFQIFNNGDQFSVTINENSPPASEEDVVRVKFVG